MCWSSESGTINFGVNLRDLGVLSWSAHPVEFQLNSMPAPCGRLILILCFIKVSKYVPAEFGNSVGAILIYRWSHDTWYSWQGLIGDKKTTITGHDMHLDSDVHVPAPGADLHCTYKTAMVWLWDVIIHPLCRLSNFNPLNMPTKFFAEDVRKSSTTLEVIYWNAHTQPLQTLAQLAAVMSSA